MAVPIAAQPLRLIPRTSNANAWQSLIAEGSFPYPFQPEFLGYLAACPGFVEDKSCLIVRGKEEIVGAMVMPVFLADGVKILSCGPIDVPPPMMWAEEKEHMREQLRRKTVDLFDRRCSESVDVASVVVAGCPANITALRAGWWASLEETAEIVLLSAEERLARMHVSKRKDVKQGESLLSVERKSLAAIMGFRELKREVGDDIWSDETWKARESLIASSAAQLFAGVGVGGRALGYEMVAVSNLGTPDAEATFLWGVVSKQMRDQHLGAVMIHGVCERLLEQGVRTIRCGTIRLQRGPLGPFVSKDPGLARFWIEMGITSTIVSRWQKTFSQVGKTTVEANMLDWLKSP